MGVMMPEGLNLVLGKRMTKSDMGALGICDTARFELMTQLPQEDPAPAAEAAVTGNENTEIKIEQEQRNEGEDMWQTCANPSEIFTDEDISHACRNVQGSLTRRQEDIMLFAVPLRRDAPFPMMPVFCFGQWEKINGEEYVIFKVKNGQLIV